MIYKNHYVEIFVNGNRLELESQKSLNMRFNRTIYDPTKISSTQAEYSFSFNIPSTPNNDKIFDYANNLSKVNKFNKRWSAEVYADGKEIFNGTLTLNSYKDKQYNVNLVSVKVFSMDEIFGDSVLSDIAWYKPFNGASSINAYNDNQDKEVAFPLVSYGAFQKEPKVKDDIRNEYTSKFDLDKYNKWWIESFYPSLNMLQTVKKAFEWKGYNVGGNAFSDPYLQDIFMSTNLASEQYPVYNLGNPRLGSINLTTTASTYNNVSGYEQELKYPYYEVWNARGQFGGGLVNEKTVQAWNYDTIYVYDLLKNGSTTLSDSYLYDPNEKCIVIPADGFYKIDLTFSTQLNTSGNLTFAQNVITDGGMGNDIEVKDVTMAAGLNEVTPIEIQLVRNYDDNIELIKGKNNKRYINGNPTQQTNYNGTANVQEWLTCFPHEDPYTAYLPTKKNDLTTGGYNWRGTGNFGGARKDTDTSNTDEESGGGSTYGGSRSGSDDDTGGSGRGGFGGRRAPSNAPRNYSTNELGYVYNGYDIMAYDQAVSPSFICGFSSMGGGCPSVMKNGYSWSKSTAEKNGAFYVQNGYNKVTKTNDNISQSSTTFNANEYIEAPTTTFSCSNNRMSGSLSCMVYLNRNDILELFEVHRALANSAGTQVLYATTTNVNLKVTAASPKTYDYLKSQDFGYNSASQFDYDLRLSNFLNNETTITSFIDGVQKAYNLQITQDGKNIWIDKPYNVGEQGNYAIEFDNRVNSNDVESIAIDYPKSMSVNYSIDTDEWGFERSVTPQSMMNEPNWEDYGDYGNTVIELNNDTYVTATSDISLPFSYTWYDNFTWIEVDSTGTQDDASTETLRIPVISNYSYMIDGYDYEESMKHDGYSLKQRFWFRPKRNPYAYVMLDSYPSERVDLYIPSNSLTINGNILNLSYKTTENSLLKYFNFIPYISSNYVKVNAHITPDEYNDIKNGAMIHFDSDLYLPSEITGFDPTNENETEITLIAKVN